MVIPSKYLELLVDCGVLPEEQRPVEQEVSLRIEERCCDEVVADEVNGCWVCCGCGKVQSSHMLIYHQPFNNQRFTYPNQSSNPFGSGGHMTITRKRHYKPLTHFKEHLRRYMGARFTPIPDEVFTEVRKQVVDLQDPYCHSKVKAVLKRMRMTRLYKEIFTIIYMAGGTAPHIEIEVYEKCVADFRVLMYQFKSRRDVWKRHCMPSMYMILDLLLKANGHTPHYHFPKLKNRKLRQQVCDMYTELRENGFYHSHQIKG